MVASLQALLQRAKLKPPFILVGASFGGLVAQLYARSHPTEVAGLVLVDSLEASFDQEIEKLLSAQASRERRDELELNQEHVRFDEILRSEAEVKAAPPLPPIPLIVLRHGIPFAPPSKRWPSAAVEALSARL